MQHRMIHSVALGLAVALLVSLMAGCGAPPAIKGPAPTPIPSLIPLEQLMALPFEESLTALYGNGHNGYH